MKKTVLNIALAAAVALPVTAFAASNGQLDKGSSEATSVLTLKIPTLYRIFGLESAMELTLDGNNRRL